MIRTMPIELDAICFEATDPVGLARFWGEILGREANVDTDGAQRLRPADEPGFSLRFRSTQRIKTQQNQMHFDLTSSSESNQQATVSRATSLGAGPTDVGQLPTERHVVLADPDGNEFCVIEPGNGFLAGCGFLGAVASDGTAAVGHFWSEALQWPLVWDQDEETAIRSPLGGAKITWGGWRYQSDSATRRLHLELTTVGDLEREVARLIELGAHRSTARTEPGRVMLADPDGNEFCLRPVPSS